MKDVITYLVVPFPDMPPHGVHRLVAVVAAPGNGEGRPHPAHRRAPLPLLNKTPMRKTMLLNELLRAIQQAEEGNEML